MSKVFKGKKMPGQMGNVRATGQNLMVYGHDLDENVLVVKGAVPGSKGNFVLISDAEKKDLPKDVPMPAGLVQVKDKKEEVKETPVEKVSNNEV